MGAWFWIISNSGWLFLSSSFKLVVFLLSIVHTFSLGLGKVIPEVCFIYSKTRCSFWIVVLSSSWFKIKLKDLEVVLVLQYSASIARSKTALEHGATTTILDSCYSVCPFESHTCTPANIRLYCLNLCHVVDHKTFFQKTFGLFTCGQLQILVELKGIAFGGGASFLVGTLSVTKSCSQSLTRSYWTLALLT